MATRRVYAAIVRGEQLEGSFARVHDVDFAGDIEAFIERLKTWDPPERLKNVTSGLITIFGPWATEPLEDDTARLIKEEPCDPAAILNTLIDAAMNQAYFLVQITTPAVSGPTIEESTQSIQAALDALRMEVKTLNEALRMEVKEVKASNEAIRMEITEVKTEVTEIIKAFSLRQFMETSTLSKISKERVNAGAVFVIRRDDRTPLCCGFFVGPRTAITVCHDPFFKRPLPFDMQVVAWTSGTVEELTLSCEYTNEKLDYAILRLTTKRRNRNAFFDLPAYDDVVPGQALGLVSMGIGLHLHHQVPLDYDVHLVTVSRSNGSSFYYDGVVTWGGDSRAAMLFNEGSVVGMHQEVLDDKPDRSPTSAGTGAGSNSPMNKRIKRVEDVHDKVSEASGSPSKTCKALLLSHIYNVVEDAIRRHTD